MDQYYKPSGKFSAVSLVYFLILSFTAFPLLGLIYAYCIWYIPFIYINFLIAAGFGFAIGFLINTFVIGKGKIRNVGLAILLGLVGGFIALYFHWSVWADLVINSGENYGTSRIGITVSNIKIFQVYALATDPSALFGLIKEINDVGVWGFGSTTVSGAFLSIIWLIELIIVVGVGVFVSFHRAKQPFCEIKNDWFKETILPAYHYILDSTKMKTDLEGNSLTVFDDLKFAVTAEDDHSVFTLYTSDQGKSYLSVENNKAKRNDKGEIEFDGDEFLEYISISNSLKETLLNKKTTPFQEEKTVEE